jgi:hypothetical protein
VLLIGKVQLVNPKRLNSDVPFIVIWQYEGLEGPARPTTGSIKKLPILENAGSAREVADSNSVADSLAAGKVVTDVDLKAISPDLP